MECYLTRKSIKRNHNVLICRKYISYNYECSCDFKASCGENWLCSHFDEFTTDCQCAIDPDFYKIEKHHCIGTTQFYPSKAYLKPKLIRGQFAYIKARFCTKSMIYMRYKIEIVNEQIYFIRLYKNASDEKIPLMFNAEDLTLEGFLVRKNPLIDNKIVIDLKDMIRLCPELLNNIKIN